MEERGCKELYISTNLSLASDAIAISISRRLIIVCHLQRACSNHVRVGEHLRPQMDTKKDGAQEALAEGIFFKVAAGPRTNPWLLLLFVASVVRLVLYQATD